MKTFMSYFIVITFSVCCPKAAYAVKKDYYNPFLKNELKAPVIVENKKSNIRITLDKVTPAEAEEGMERYVGRIYIDNNMVYEERNLDYASYHRLCVFDPKKSIIADLDSNGLDDIILPTDSVSDGIPCLRDHLLIYSQIKNGIFFKYDIPAVSFLKDNIVDFDGDGKWEFVTCFLAEAYGHSYWIYRVWRLEKEKIVSVDEQFRFPRAVQFTYRANSKTEPSEKLSEIMTGEYGYVEKMIYRIIDHYKNFDNENDIYPDDWQEVVCNRERLGKQIQLYKSGQKIIEWERKGGKPVGIWQYWNEDRTLRWKQTFKEGHFSSKMEWYPEIQPQTTDVATNSLNSVQ